MKIIKLLYEKLVKINDSPQRIAMGLGLGVFSGIFPGTGLVASLFLAFLFRANRASALLGSLATNTWLSIVTFLLAIKTGSAILGVNWQEVQKNITFKTATLEVVFPLVVGYCVISLVLGLLVYLISWPIIVLIRYLSLKDRKVCAFRAIREEKNEDHGIHPEE